MIRREALAAANKTFKTIDLERKDSKTGKKVITPYAPVNEKVKAFRIMSPNGRIVTKLEKFDKDKAIFTATVYDEDGRILATAHSYECIGSSNINRSGNLIENSETGAIGRALSFCGFDTNISSVPVNSIAEANANIKTIPIHGKEYAEVDERVGAFRSQYPDGSIQTTVIYEDEATVVFSASVYNSTGELLATSTACESREDKGVNQYHYWENAETSSIGRALALCGYGCDISIASANDMMSASSFATTDQRNKIDHLLAETGTDVNRLLEHYGVRDLDSLDELTAEKFISTLEKVQSQKKTTSSAILDAAKQYAEGK